MGGEQNWLLHLTVNQASYGIRGSSPWPPTILKCITANGLIAVSGSVLQYGVTAVVKDWLWFTPPDRGI
jgi:hypothetical protein